MLCKQHAAQLHEERGKTKGAFVTDDVDIRSLDPLQRGRSCIAHAGTGRLCILRRQVAPRHCEAEDISLTFTGTAVAALERVESGALCVQQPCRHSSLTLRRVTWTTPSRLCRHAALLIHAHGQKGQIPTHASTQHLQSAMDAMSNLAPDTTAAARFAVRKMPASRPCKYERKGEHGKPTMISAFSSQRKH